MVRKPPLSLVEICETQMLGIRSPISSIGFLTHVHHQWAHGMLILTVPLTWSFLGSGLISWGMNLIGPLICLLDLLVPSGSISMAMSASSLLAWSHSEHCLEKDERQRERVRKPKESGILLLSFGLVLVHLLSFGFQGPCQCFSIRSRCVVFIPTKGLLKYPAQTIYEIEEIAKFFSTSKSFFDYTVLLSQGQAVASN